jgi:hypothetical protein
MELGIFLYQIQAAELLNSAAFILMKRLKSIHPGNAVSDKLKLVSSYKVFATSGFSLMLPGENYIRT